MSMTCLCLCRYIHSTSRIYVRGKDIYVYIGGEWVLDLYKHMSLVFLFSQLTILLPFDIHTSGTWVIICSYA